MVTIEIAEETKTLSRMAEVLRHIADHLDQGYISGIEPNWQTHGEELDLSRARRCSQCQEPLEPDATECDACTSILLEEADGTRVGDESDSEEE